MYKIEFSNEENGYIMTCGETGLKEFITEDEFCEMVESGKLVDTSEDVDFDECDCPYCTGVRDGIQIGLDMAVEVIENLDEDEYCGCECGECCEECSPEDFDDDEDDETAISNMIHEDIQSMLLNLKGEIGYQFTPVETKVKLIDLYVKLYNLIY